MDGGDGILIGSSGLHNDLGFSALFTSYRQPQRSTAIKRTGESPIQQPTSNRRPRAPATHTTHARPPSLTQRHAPHPPARPTGAHPCAWRARVPAAADRAGPHGRATGGPQLPARARLRAAAADDPHQQGVLPRCAALVCCSCLFDVR